MIWPSDLEGCLMQLVSNTKVNHCLLRLSATRHIKQSIHFTGYHQIYTNPVMISWLPRSCVGSAWTPGLHAAVPLCRASLHVLKQLPYLTTQLLLHSLLGLKHTLKIIVVLVPWLSSGFVLLRIRSYCSVEFAYWVHVQSSDVLLCQVRTLNSYAWLYSVHEIYWF